MSTHDDITNNATQGAPLFAAVRLSRLATDCRDDGDTSMWERHLDNARTAARNKLNSLARRTGDAHRRLHSGGRREYERLTAHPFVEIVDADGLVLETVR